MNIIDIGTGQVMTVEFQQQDVIKTMIQTCYAFPKDYPTIEFQFNGKVLKAWLVGYKPAGEPVFMLRNGTCVTKDLKKLRSTIEIVWRLRLQFNRNGG